MKPDGPRTQVFVARKTTNSRRVQRGESAWAAMLTKLGNRNPRNDPTGISYPEVEHVYLIYRYRDSTGKLQANKMLVDGLNWTKRGSDYGYQRCIYMRMT